MAEEPSFLQERTRSARENLTSLLLVVIILGFAIGLVTNLLSAYIIDKESFWPWFISALFVAACITVYIMSQNGALGPNRLTTRLNFDRVNVS